MTPDPAAFAQDWEAAWNSHDIDRILSHYAEDVVFRSRKAIPIMGSGEIVGLAELRKYWAAALERQPNLSFRVSNVFHGHDIIVLTYTNHAHVNAAETLRFNDASLIVSASAAHETLQALA